MVMEQMIDGVVEAEMIDGVPIIGRNDLWCGGSRND